MAAVGQKRSVARGALTALGIALDEFLSKADPRMALGKIVEASELIVAKSPVESLCLPALRPQPKTLKTLRFRKFLGKLHQLTPDAFSTKVRRYPQLIDIDPVPQNIRGENRSELFSFIEREPLDSLFLVLRSSLLLGMCLKSRRYDCLLRSREITLVKFYVHVDCEM